MTVLMRSEFTVLTVKLPQVPAVAALSVYRVFGIATGYVKKKKKSKSIKPPLAQKSSLKVKNVCR